MTTANFYTEFYIDFVNKNHMYAHTMHIHIVPGFIYFLIYLQTATIRQKRQTIGAAMCYKCQSLLIIWDTILWPLMAKVYNIACVWLDIPVYGSQWN